MLSTQRRCQDHHLHACLSRLFLGLLIPLWVTACSPSTSESTFTEDQIHLQVAHQAAMGLTESKAEHAATRFEQISHFKASNGSHIRFTRYHNERRALDGQVLVHVAPDGEVIRVSHLLKEPFQAPPSIELQDRTGPSLLKEGYESESVYYAGIPSTRYEGELKQSGQLWWYVFSDIDDELLLDGPTLHEAEISVPTEGAGHYYHSSVDLTEVSLGVPPGNWKRQFLVSYSLLYDYETCNQKVASETVSPEFIQNTCEVGQTAKMYWGPCAYNNFFNAYRYPYLFHTCVDTSQDTYLIDDQGPVYHMDVSRGRSTFGHFQTDLDKIHYGTRSIEGHLGTGLLYTGPYYYTGPVMLLPNFYALSPEMLAHLDMNTLAVDVLYTFSNAWDYFKTSYGHKGFAPAYQRVSLIPYAQCNAYFTSAAREFKPNAITARSGYPQIGIGLCHDVGPNGGKYNFRFTSTLDIMAHEFTHGVVKYSADLINEGESGAINESLADVFGTLAEFYAAAPEDQPDYTMGEMLGAPKRHLYHPSLDGSSIDCASELDQPLGIHHLAGLGNHFFYLLAEGNQPAGLPESPTCNGENITGIGKGPAGKIVYSTLTQCLLPTSDYCHYRQCTLMTAPFLYKTKVKKAWNAVGLTDALCPNLNLEDVGSDFL